MPPRPFTLEHLLKRTLIALALAGALLAPAALSPLTSLAAYCTSNTIGSQTYTNCYGDDGASSRATTTQIGDSSYTNIYGSDGSSSRGTTTQIGDSTYSHWSTYP